MRNLIIFTIFIMALLLVQFTYAQPVDEIINKYVAALGGADKLTSIKTLKMEGSMTVQGMDLSITNTRTQNVGLRMDIEVMGTANYQVANKDKGSVFWPVRGMTEPEDMEPEQFKSAFNQLDLQGALFNYKSKGVKVEFIKKEMLDGAEAYQLKVTAANGIVSNYFIDIKTNRLVKTTGKFTANGQEMELVTSYSDYKQNAEGYWFAYTVTNTQGVIHYDKISTNIQVDENIYKN